MKYENQAYAYNHHHFLIAFAIPQNIANFSMAGLIVTAHFRHNAQQGYLKRETIDKISTKSVA